MFEELTIASLPCSDGYSSTLQTISLTRPQGALAIKAKHQFLFFEHFYFMTEDGFQLRFRDEWHPSQSFIQPIGSRIVKDTRTLC